MKFLASAGARFAALNAVIAILIAGLLSGATYVFAVRVIDTEVQSTVEAELRGLAEQFNRDGYAALVTAIRSRVTGSEPDAVYLLTDAFGRRMAGNLQQWPPVIVVDGRWQTLDLYREDSTTPTVVGLRAFVLPGGMQLLVGRDLKARSLLASLTVRTLLLIALIAAILMFIGGQLLSRYLMRRIATVVATTESIMAGDLNERVPEHGDDEFDRLAHAVNAMLDRIELLMTTMRTVTDSVAHDLKRPLTRLRSGLELALHDSGENSPQGAALGQALVDVQSVQATLNALLDIARAESGLGHEHFEALDLATIASTIAELYEPLFEAKHMALDIHLAPDCRVDGHRELLSQAIANLLENASRYAPPNSHVALSLRAEGDQCVLSVDDHGPGIPAADRERVLARFVRLDDARSTDGAGLGLSLVHAVARLHGGTLTLDDNAPGQGLRAVMRLPRALLT